MTGPEDTHKSLRALDGAICPRCRYVLRDPTEGKLPRCPYHPDTVMVAPRALADADGDPFLGMIIGGRFAVVELLGAGSMGTVYRARQEAMGRDVALKVVRSDRLVDPQAVGRFQQEAHATSLLTSPHTVTVFDFGEIRVSGDDPHFIDGSLFLAMELLDGESLGSRLKRVGRIRAEEAKSIVRQALVSLAEAHEKGVIHRDLKPDNLLLVKAPDGRGEMVKVLDFGIAKLLTHQGGIDALETQAGTVFGTPRYMSPEQAQGKRLDARSDLYSLGVILYHMLLGKPPYTDSDAVVVMAHHIKTVPRRPSVADPSLGIAADLEELLMRVLDKDPTRRPQSAIDFISELDALGSLSAAAPAPASTASAELTAVVGGDPRAAPSRTMMLAGVGSAALLVLMATVAVAMTTERTMLLSSTMATAVGAAVLGAVGEASVERSEQPVVSPAERPAASAETELAQPPPPRGSPHPSKPRGYQRFDR